MKNRIKSTLAVMIALAGFSSLNASAITFYQSQVTVSNGGFTPPAIYVPRPPVCRYVWKNQWRYDQWGNYIQQHVQVEVCY
ncbi:hypothetical protein [Psychromonas aquimarina]|uniref:hypothetical protein n=1 Tax=Psychromonas aquimarina TaxID=444919 RepID=UPI00048C9D97|nr:hypothetical protein [Psychromonas aquimarina]